MALLLAVAFGNTIRAQPAPVVLDSIRSSVLGETRVVRIGLPVQYDAPQYASERYPVLIMIDAGGGAGFMAAVAMSQALSGNISPALPRMLVVAVEVPSATRFRDLTIPLAGSGKRDDGGGGAPAFLRFLSTELHPYIAARYRADSVVVLEGHSLAGFFAAWAFGRDPDFVRNAIAVSPTPLEQQQVLDGIVGRKKPGRLFLVSGTSEGGLDRETQTLAAALTARPAAIRVEHQRLPEVSHFNTRPLGLVPGLRFIFRPVSLAGYQLAFSDTDDRLARFTAVFDSTRGAYMRGARELGLPQRLPFTFLAGWGRYYQGPGVWPALLLRLCQEIVDSYPSTWHGYECAADAQVRLGHTSDAAANYRRAIAAAGAAGDSANARRIMRKADSP